MLHLTKTIPFFVILALINVDLNINKLHELYPHIGCTHDEMDCYT